MEIHLDLIGGLAGDMFVAALLDAYPALLPDVSAAVAAFATDDVELRCSSIPHNDGFFVGRRFEVHVPVTKPLSRLQISSSYAAHSHTTWRSIRARLQESNLAASALRHALGIFQLLAEAEGCVHGVAADEVSFHEVGAWDSIADIVSAAVLIDKLKVSRWTTSPAPLGGGRTRSAHGIIPQPAPATIRLLIGFPTVDDGIGGERVTPTGAAILRYLCRPEEHHGASHPSTRGLHATGFGFGTRKLSGISNCVRVLCFTAQVIPNPSADRPIQVLEFEVDDQSGEDLAMGLDRLRAHRGVLDVTQSAVFGKKGRMMTHVQVLARAADAEEVIDQCFRQTTTIGLRRQVVQGVGLKRQVETTHVNGHPLRVKVVERPGGRTAKTESDDVASHSDHFSRSRLRTAAEAAVLAPEEVDSNA